MLKYLLLTVLLVGPMACKKNDSDDDRNNDVIVTGRDPYSNPYHSPYYQDQWRDTCDTDPRYCQRYSQECYTSGLCPRPGMPVNYPQVSDQCRVYGNQPNHYNSQYNDPRYQDRRYQDPRNQDPRMNGRYNGYTGRFAPPRQYNPDMFFGSFFQQIQCVYIQQGGQWMGYNAQAYYQYMYSMYYQSNHGSQYDFLTWMSSQFQLSYYVNNSYQNVWQTFNPLAYYYMQYPYVSGCYTQCSSAYYQPYLQSYVGGNFNWNGNGYGLNLNLGFQYNKVKYDH